MISIKTLVIGQSGGTLFSKMITAQSPSWLAKAVIAFASLTSPIFHLLYSLYLRPQGLEGIN